MTTEPITRLLDAARSGDLDASAALFNAVYKELQSLARAHRRRWRGNDTLNTTALIHEAFLKLAGPADFVNRKHFFATASKAMRQVLVNYAEQQRTAKRGGDALRVTLDEATLASEVTAEELLDLHRVLTRLEAENPRRCRIVECRVFGGMTIEEAAEALSISPATVKREWQIASAQIYRELEAARGTPAPNPR
ncbi:MAG TPA: ECF-type sigma factor [Woeseiaceae bacterium]|nr:ECF-type sigma factor [Woeseiaceae bacterium]